MATTKTCEACGATVQSEHIDQGRAGRWAGQLLCTVCYAEKRSAIEGVGKSAAPLPSPAPGDLVDVVPVEPVDAPVPVQPAGDAPTEEDEPISLVDVDDERPTTSRIKNISQLSGTVTHRTDFDRKTAVTGQGICRVRTFHSKIQVESLEYLDNTINDWLDENPDVEVKLVTSTIGVMAGKHPEPNLILNIWY